MYSGICMIPLITAAKGAYQVQDNSVPAPVPMAPLKPVKSFPGVFSHAFTPHNQDGILLLTATSSSITLRVIYRLQPIELA